jgi:two-component system, cell cycle sensor histidine kinase and response regulator CckA
MEQPLQILYVDDYQYDRELVREALEVEPGAFQLTEAASRAEFEMRLVEQEYDLVLSDFNILGFDGLAVVAAVRDIHPQTPVILVTGTGSEEIAVEAMKQGVADYVIKSPRHIQRLPQAIRTALEKWRLEAEHRCTEEALLFERSLIEVLFKNAPDAIYFKDQEARFIRVSQSLADLLDMSPDGLIGKTDMDIFPGELARQKYDDDLSVIKTGNPLIGKEEMDITKAGKSRWVSTTKFPWCDREGNIRGLFGISRDITEHKKMEQELIHLERLRAVGELSAGVSHNLNNILTNVLGPAQLLKRKTDDPELLREVDDIVTSAVRARDLVHELHLSVRTGEEEKLKPVSIDLAVQQAVQTARPRWKDEPEARGIAIEMVTHWGGAPLIRGTESGLHDILTNLIFNAVDAMPEGGTIHIRMERVEDQVQIAFSDTGTGMDEATRRRIFEPFFTTKMDIGTGLGLSTVYNRVDHWGGTIEVDSTPGEGTRFTLRFPVWAKEVVEEKKKIAIRSSRSGKILIVDDDEAICSLLLRLLGEYHQAEAVTDGRQALERFAPGKYDVVMIDLGMSEMPGNQVAREMMQVDPAASLVLITGWDLTPDDQRVTLLADDPRLKLFDFHIQKPFDDLDEVEDVVARAIAGHDRRAARE